MAGERRPHGAQRSSLAERQYAMTCEEVAQVMGCSSQRVSQLQVRALKKLRRGLAARGYGPAEIDNLPRWLIARMFHKSVKAAPMPLIFA